MSSSIVAQIIERVNALPDSLQQDVLQFVLTLQQEPLQESSSDAWDVLESLAGTIEAPTDWSTEHDYYLYGTPKRKETES